MKIDQIIHAYNTLTQPRTSHRDGNKAKVSQHFIKSNLGGETLLHFSQTKHHTHYSYYTTMYSIHHIRNQDTRKYRKGARLCSVTRVCMICPAIGLPPPSAPPALPGPVIQISSGRCSRSSFPVIGPDPGRRPPIGWGPGTNK